MASELFRPSSLHAFQHRFFDESGFRVPVCSNVVPALESQTSFQIGVGIGGLPMRSQVVAKQEAAFPEGTSTTLADLVGRSRRGVAHSAGIAWVEALRRGRGWLA
jgi:hypothetical protein